MVDEVAENSISVIGIASDTPKNVDTTELVKWHLTDQLDANILKCFSRARSRPLFYFQSISTKSGNSIAIDLYVYDYIELMNEFLSKNIHEGEEYSLIKNGIGYRAYRGKSSDRIPEFHVDIYDDHQIIETLKFRRYEMRVAVNKIKRLLSRCECYY